jgi:hypothetical protein
MTDPITPPLELLDKWCMDSTLGNWRDIATQAAQWGANQELEACLKHLFQRGFSDADTLCLRAARRPKPPGLKEQAFGALGRFNTNAHTRADEMDQDFDLIRRALEALPND